MRKHIVLITSVALALTAGALIGFYWSGERQGRAPAAAAPMHRAGPFQIAARVAPATPVVGENTVLIELADLGGAPVTGAQIRAVATMPAMGAMPEMRAPATVTESRPGHYEGPFTLRMDGSWPLTLEISKEGVGEATLRFELATRRPGLRLSSDASLAAEAGESELSPAGTITLDARRRQAIGVTIAEVLRAPLQRRVRAVGRVTYDETRVSDVTLRFDAWIGELVANYVGAAVQQGETLFTAYGPELLAAQQEYLEARRRAATGPLVAAARKRLELWNVPAAQIDALERRGTALDYVPIAAPRSGTVVSKNIVEGTAHRAGATLLRIADLSRVWIEAEVYEADLSLVTPGMLATISFPYLRDVEIEGVVDYVYPYLDEQSRTARVRVVLDNPDGLLKPEMYAEVALDAELGERLVVPVESVIFAGARRVVFEDLGNGRLAPRVIRTGFRAGELIEVVEGLEAGARVVASGTFLVASESRLQSGLEQW